MPDINIITVRISEYLSHELVEGIAFFQWHTTDEKTFTHLRRMLFDGARTAGSFNVLAQTSDGGVVGRLWCLRHSAVQTLWYYGDLAVETEFRRRGIASLMIKAAAEQISERGGLILRTYVEPDNNPSLALQKSLGFKVKTYEPFDYLLNEGRLMLELDIPNILNTRPAAAEDAMIICQLYDENKDILHGGEISYKSWQDIIQADRESGEVHLLIYKGALPCAWLKLNCFEGDKAWISMLVVAKNMHRQGIGTYALRYAEEYMRDRGIRRAAIHTIDDNIPAQMFYKSCGYIITEYDSECTTGDGVSRHSLTLEKEI